MNFTFSLKENSERTPLLIPRWANYFPRRVDELLKFKGADWAGMFFGLIATYLLAKERRSGFIYGVIGGIGWVTFGFLTGSIAGILANLFFIGFNCHGFFRWKRKQDERKQRGC